jgi:hypothetical protein
MGKPLHVSSRCCHLTGEAHYHLHSHFHGRQHDSTSTYTQRLQVFTANKAKVLAHNKKVAAAAAAAGSPAAAAAGSPAAAAAAGGHTLELNHFADMSREEFDRVMLPLKWRRDHGFQVQRVNAAVLRHSPGLLQGLLQSRVAEPCCRFSVH